MGLAGRIRTRMSFGFRTAASPDFFAGKIPPVGVCGLTWSVARQPGLQDRVARFPQEAQDEVFGRAATRNAECTAIARESLDALRKKLGVRAT
jgi:hypothetical protein